MRAIASKQLWYIYFLHEDGDMMLFVREEDEPDISKPPVGYRFTPYHRVTWNNLPALFESAQAARQFIGEILWAQEKRPSLFIGAWRGIDNIHTNPMTWRDWER